MKIKWKTVIKWKIEPKNEKNGFFFQKIVKIDFFSINKKNYGSRSFRFLMCYRNNHYDNQVPKIMNQPTSHAKKSDFNKNYNSYGSKNEFIVVIIKNPK